MYPVRSLAGRRCRPWRSTARGLTGDRAWTVVGRRRRASSRPRTSRGWPTCPRRATRTPTRGRSRTARPRRSASCRRPGRHRRRARCTSSPAAAIEPGRRRRGPRGLLGRRPAGEPGADPAAATSGSLGGPPSCGWARRSCEVTRTPKHCLGVYADVRDARPDHRRGRRPALASPPVLRWPAGLLTLALLAGCGGAPPERTPTTPLRPGPRRRPRRWSHRGPRRASRSWPRATSSSTRTSN